jgi:exopolyphosphatase/pppGpp-phosphohydrolase
MPDYPTLAAVDLGSNSFGFDITRPLHVAMLVCAETILAEA